MISPSDIEYELTKKIKKGEIQLKYPFDSLADWIMNNYGVRPINIIYDLLPHDKRPRLQVIFEGITEHGLFTSKMDYSLINRLKNKCLDFLCK